MKIKRIDIIRPNQSPYAMINYFIPHLHKAFESIGIESRLVEFEPAIVNVLSRDPPDFTLTFNSFEQDTTAQFLCDIVKIPNIFYLTDLPHSYLFLLRSPNSFVTCVDSTGTNFLRATGSKQVHFMSLAVEKSLQIEPNLERIYEVVLPATCIDYEDIQSFWKEKYSQELYNVLIEAADLMLNDRDIYLYEALVFALYSDPMRQAKIDPNVISGPVLFEELNLYVSGKARVELIRAIKGANVHIFGGTIGRNGWDKYVGQQSNVTIHDPVPFQQLVEIMKKSQIVLNNSPCIKHGAHPRIFTGIACGAMVFTGANAYICEQFKDRESLAFYRYNELTSLDELIAYYLSEPIQRCSVVEKGQQIVQQNHTWEHRAKELIDWLAHCKN